MMLGKNTNVYFVADVPVGGPTVLEIAPVRKPMSN